MNIDYKDIDLFIEQNRAGIIRDIGRLVAVPSVEGEAQPDAPYGKEPKRALELGLEIAAELGLETRNFENRIGCGEIHGESEKYLATITHVDVVPAGDGWSADPYTMRERNGWIIGRGVLDDKGPSIICLYALKYLKEKNVPLRYGVRALLGSNEETHMDDVEYYLKNYPAPAFCFSPDADFPVCNGEKGIFQGELVSKCPLDTIISINGGFAVNAVPDKATAVLKCSGKLPESTESVSVSAADGKITLVASGKSGHASLPEGTVNAIGVLINFILDNGLCSSEEAEYLSVLKKLHSSPYGKGVGADSEDGRFSPLTIVGGMIRIKDGRILQSVDSRYPTSTSGKKIAEALEHAANGAAEVIVKGDVVPFYIDPNSTEIQTCLNTYNEVTGEHAQTFTMGGGTYARHFPNAASFGPEHPDRPMPDFAGSIHGVDEAACVDWLLEALKVYIATLIRLEEVDF